MKTSLQKLGIMLFTAVLLASPLTALADNDATFPCSWLNYQDNMACENFDEGEGKCLAPADPTEQNNYNQFSKANIVVITESPFSTGNPFGDSFSKICARQTQCLAVLTAAPATTPETPATADAPAATQEEPINLKEQVSCYSKYVDVSACENQDYDEDGIGKNCEYVQVFIAANGPQLLYGFVGVLYRYFATIGGLIAVLTIIISGIMIASAGGTSEKITKAKAMITRSLIGLVVLFLSALILYAINPNFFTIT